MCCKVEPIDQERKKFFEFFWQPNLWVKINAERAVSECRRLRFTFSTDSLRFKRCTAHFRPPNFVKSNRALIKRGYDSEPAKRRKKVPENLPCRWKSMKFATLWCIAAIIASGSDVLMWKSYKFPVSLTPHKLARASRKLIYKIDFGGKIASFQCVREKREMGRKENLNCCEPWAHFSSTHECRTAQKTKSTTF